MLNQGTKLASGVEYRGEGVLGDLRRVCALPLGKSGRYYLPEADVTFTNPGVGGSWEAAAVLVHGSYGEDVLGCLPWVTADLHSQDSERP